MTVVRAPAVAPPKPPQLDKKKREVTKPTSPTIRRMTPTTWMLTPLTVALTAQISTAPTAVRTRLKLIPIFHLRCHAWERRGQIDDPLRLLANTATTIATTMSRNRNFDMAIPPPIARMRRTSKINHNIAYLLRREP
jgi:hypothetical protein